MWRQRVATISLAYSFTIMLTGAFVRLSGSGLGCSKWPVCEEAELVGLSDPNAAIESLNRVYTGLIAVPLAALVVLGWHDRRERPDLVRWPLLALALVAANALLGALSVMTHLHPAVVGSHFMLALALVWATLVARQRSIAPPGAGQPNERRVQQVAWMTWVAATVTVVAGIVVTGSGPHAGGAGADRFDVDLRSAARTHSATAWILVACTVALAITVARSAPERRRDVQLLIAACLAQGAIGYTQYAIGVPRGLVLAHIGGAALVWTLATWFLLPRRARSDRTQPERALAGRAGTS